MYNYRLVFPPGNQPAPDGGLSFDAADPASALLLAQRHGGGRPAELWRGDKLVCRLAEDTSAGFWEIG